VGVVSEVAKNWSGFVADLAQVGAILIGGWWAYNRFIREREGRPRAALQLTVSHRKLSRQHTLVRVGLRIHNPGSVLLHLRQLRFDVYQVLPLADEAKSALEAGTLIPSKSGEAEWPCIGLQEQEWDEGKVEIEPGEDDEYGRDFVIPSSLETIFVYAFVKNVSKAGREIGWTLSNFYDLSESTGDDRKLAEKVSAHG
jgi:hypothetical protein